MNINITEAIKKMMGWCPSAEMMKMKEMDDMITYEGKYMHRIKGLGFRGVLGIMHLLIGVWLMVTAIRVLARPLIFSWWFMDIVIFSSGILLLVGLISLVIFLDLIRSSNVHRIFASANIIFMLIFFIYLSQFLIVQDPLFSIFDKPYQGYLFGIVTLVLFTLLISIPSLLTIFIRSGKENRSGNIKIALFVLVLTFASLGGYYMYLNDQKNAAIIDEFGSDGNIKLYRVDSMPSYYNWGNDPYFLDSRTSTTGHSITQDTYEAIKFLQSIEYGKVIAWWDFELEVKAGNKDPVIKYASESIKTTIARPASLYDEFEPDEKVADVSRFFTTSSEDTAKSIAEKYGANLVYMSKQRMESLFSVMLFAAGSDFNQQDPGINTREEFFEKAVKPSMAYKFDTGEGLQYFEKIFENEGVVVFRLK